MKKRRLYSSRLNSPKILNTRKRYQKENKLASSFKNLFKITIIILIIFGISFLFNNDYLKIREINIKTKDDFSVKIQEIINSNLQKNTFMILPNSNFIILNTNKIEEQIKNDIPEIKNIKINKKFPNKLEVENSLHEATIGWETQDKKYLLNEDGYILKETDNFEGFLFVKDSTNLPLKKDERVVYPNFITFSKQINEKVSQLSIKIQHLEIKETTFMINCYTVNGYKIIFNTTKSIEDQINKLTETINFLEGNIKKLDYVDVTVKNKAIYKLK
jgi:cell division septal protein FtsQ